MSSTSGKNNYQKNASKSTLIGNLISINDLRDKEYSGQALTEEEKRALQNFDKYRLAQLSSQKNERDFHNKYIQLQAMANLSPYWEFLKENYL